MITTSINQFFSRKRKMKKKSHTEHRKLKGKRKEYGRKRNLLPL